MTKRIFLFVLACLLNVAASQTFAAGVGTWKLYMAYSDITWVEKGSDRIYVLASDNLYAYNENDNSIQTFDKLTGLNGSDIDFIAWNNTAKRLVIVYADYNIDLLDEKGNVTNISDYYSKSMTGSKTVNDLYMHGNFCYISTGFGIMKLNVSRAEISDTYNLGFNVSYTYVEGNSIFASSSTNGLYKGVQTDNLLDRNNWTRVGEHTARNKTMDAELLAKAKALNPGGPKYNRFFNMTFRNERLYSVGGLFESGSMALNHPGTVQVLKDNEWTVYEDNLAPKTGVQYVDVNCIAVDPKNPNHVFVGGRSGLYEFLDGNFQKLYNSSNSLLRPAMDKGKELDDNYVLINSMAFDDSGNLWILNSQSKSQTILELSRDGKMTSHHQSALMKSGVGPDLMKGAMFDSRKLLWFVNGDSKFPGLFCFQPSTGGFNVFARLVNQDGSTVAATSVKCVAEDLENNIWIGTNVGPLVLETSQMNNPSEAVYTQVKVPRNDGTNLADYLLAGVDISCMAIDGGGRKWFGTGSNGVYLISEDNMTQIHHFLTSNSKLLSNNIESIAINDKTGEVFFGTDKGLCSYMSDATKGVDKMDTDVTYAYPNPVRPGYTGPITIVGLTYNADVKIVTTNGILVNQGTSNGGSYVWDGTDMNGKQVASGVYMVETADQYGNNGTVCKVAIVR